MQRYDISLERVYVFGGKVACAGKNAPRALGPAAASGQLRRGAALWAAVRGGVGGKAFVHVCEGLLFSIRRPSCGETVKVASHFERSRFAFRAQSFRITSAVVSSCACCCGVLGRPPRRENADETGVFGGDAPLSVGAKSSMKSAFRSYRHARLRWSGRGKCIDEMAFLLETACVFSMEWAGGGMMERPWLCGQRGVRRCFALAGADGEAMLFRMRARNFRGRCAVVAPIMLIFVDDSSAVPVWGCCPQVGRRGWTMVKRQNAWKICAI